LGNFKLHPSYPFPPVFFYKKHFDIYFLLENYPPIQFRIVQKSELPKIVFTEIAKDRPESTNKTGFAVLAERTISMTYL